MDTKLYFFGCFSPARKGHYLYCSTDGRTTNKREVEREFNNVNCSILEFLDGTLCQRLDQKEALYVVSDIWPFKIVSWWDRTGDSRMNSNSNLIGYGFQSAEEIIDAAIDKYPSVMSRQSRPTPLTLPIK